MERLVDRKRLFFKRVAPAFLLCVFAVCCVAVPGCLFNLSRDDGAVEFFSATGDLLPDPALVSGTLDNGFSFALMTNNRPENRVDMHLVIEAGSMHETDEQQGLAHYLEHMMFNGTTHFPPGELVKYFQAIGMGFGNDVNAHTGFFRTVYVLNLPAGDAEHLRQGLQVMMDYARGALLLESEVDKERGIILAEKRTRDSASYRTFKASLDYELAGSRIIRRYPIGVEEVLQTTGRDRLESFYDTWYRPERMTLVVVGDFDPDMAAAEIKSVFTDMQPRTTACADPGIGATVHEGTTALYHYEKEAGSTEVTLETLSQTPRPADSMEERKKRFMRRMAYRIVNYRLDELAEQPDPPFTSAYASAGRALQHYSYASISADAVPEKWENALVSVEKVLRAVLAYGFTQSEVDRVQREVMAEMDRAVLQAPTRENSDLSRQIMMSLAAKRAFQSPEQSRALLAPVAESLTPAMLHQAFKETWAPEARLILVTGNAEIAGADETEIAGADGAEEKIISVWRKSRNEAVQKPDEKTIRPFPYLPDPQEKGKVVRETTEEDLGVVCIDFENGVRLNMKKTDFKANQVIAEVRFGRGESTEPEEQPALCELGLETLNESGFGGMKKEDLRLALAGKKADFSFSVLEDRFRLGGSCAADEVRLLFQLFYTFFNDWICTEDAYRLSLERFRQQYDESRHTLSGAMTLEGDRFLAGNDSRFGWPPEFASFESLRLEDIRSWISGVLRQSLPEISVVGDFDREQVVDAVALYFGTLQISTEGNITASSRPNPFVPAGELKVLTVPTEIDKAYVEVAWPTDDFWNIARTRRLIVLSHVLTDRMRRVIREEAGQSYSQYAYHEASLAYPGYGLFHAAATVNPEDAREVITAIKGIAADIIENGVTGEELSRAKEPIVTGIKEMVETNGYWLRSVLSGCRAHPERLDWSRNFRNDYQSVSTDDLTRLARQYLDVSRCTIVIVKPESTTQINP